jgi:FAD/FMN-containing dehydrogenase
MSSEYSRTILAALVLAAVVVAGLMFLDEFPRFSESFLRPPLRSRKDRPMEPSSGTQALSIPAFRAAIKGRVIAADDAGYDEARTVFPGGIDRRPAVIVRVADATDVARVISLARETGLELAVRSGGHSGAGHGVCEGGIVLDLSDMDGLDIDTERRTAWAETGLTTGAYTNAVGELGLATGFGDTGTVGIGGITLGGGVGFLVRKHGLTIDSLLGADVVTADGELRRVDAEADPDLFWAIRGGGGNFGVATRFLFRLHELPSVVGGMLLLPASADVITAFLAEAAAAPEELSTIVNVMPAPPMPFVPDEHRGRLVVMALMVYAGPTEAGERAVAPLRSIATPIVDLIRPMGYREMFQPAEEGYHPVAVGRTMFLDAIEPDTVDVILERLEASTAPMRVTQVRVLGGAMARVPADATAFAHRTQPLMASVGAVYERPAEAQEHEAWVTELAGRLREGRETAAYANFLGDEGEARVREAYPEPTWTRLAEIKRRYDPTNLFRRNHNIPPVGTSASG